MCYRLAIDLRIYPLSCCVKIGDTESDIAEGHNAGMWTIGITRSGNSVGLSEVDWSKLGDQQSKHLLACAEREFRSAGAHYTAETVAHTLPILNEIERRIAAGERPE
jgi:phosphonoacetaldehyde hydrolase